MNMIYEKDEFRRFLRDLAIEKLYDDFYGFLKRVEFKELHVSLNKGCENIYFFVEKEFFLTYYNLVFPEKIKVEFKFEFNLTLDSDHKIFATPKISYKYLDHKINNDDLAYKINNDEIECHFEELKSFIKKIHKMILKIAELFLQEKKIQFETTEFEFKEIPYEFKIVEKEC